jgi:co-chaperonin GroES (HSP10)
MVLNKLEEERRKKKTKFHAAKMAPTIPVLTFWSLIVAFGEGFVFTPSRSLVRSKYMLPRAHVLDSSVPASRLQPMSNYVLVKLQPDNSNKLSNGGIVLPEDGNKWKPMDGTVIACGTGNVRGSESKAIVEGCNLPKVGEHILFRNSGGVEVSVPVNFLLR